MSIYETIYTLLSEAIFGTGTLAGYTELVCVLLSSCATIFVFAIPFIIVWKVITGLCDL